MSTDAAAAIVAHEITMRLYCCRTLLFNPNAGNNIREEAKKQAVTK